MSDNRESIWREVRMKGEYSEPKFSDVVTAVAKSYTVRSITTAIVVILLMMPSIAIENADGAVPTVQVLNLWPQQDSRITDGLPFSNFGGDQYLYVGYFTFFEFPDHWAILIQFDLSILPSDATIQDADLKLTLQSGNGTSVQTWRISEAWDERTVTWDNAPSRVTHGLDTTRDWYIGTTPLAQYSVDVTSWVDGWFNGTYTNHGMMILPEPFSTWSYSFLYSKDGAILDPSNVLLKIPKLTVTFISSTMVEQPPPPDPPPWIDDSTPPTVAMSVTPYEDISMEDTVQIMVIANDDICLDQMTLTVDGVVVFQELVPFIEVNRTEISVVYETSGEELGFGDHHVLANAIDRVSQADGRYQRIHVGGNTPPEVYVHCEPSMILPEDNSTIEVSVTASDPEGLKKVVIGLENAVWDPDAHPDHAVKIEFTEPYPTSYTTTVSFPNLNVPFVIGPAVNATDITCTAHVIDVENLYSTAHEDIEVIRPYQWDFGIPYENPFANNLGWGRMEDTFGHGELWGPGSLDWWHTIVAQFWKPIYNVMARNGECFGMSMYSLWHAHNGIPVPDTLTEHVGDELPPVLPGYNEHLYAKRAIEIWQGAQISQEILGNYISQIMDELDASIRVRPFVTGEFERLKDDIEAGRPGVLLMAEYRGLDGGVMECVGAHAVVPWLVRETGTDSWQIYVYDSNRPLASTTQYTDFDNYEHYPFVELTSTGFAWDQLTGRNWDWSVVETERWNDLIWYIPYDTAARNDYDLMDGWLVALATLIMLTVGPLVISISHLLPIPLPFATGESGIQSYAMPSNEDFEVNLTGTEDGEYSWVISADHSCYGLINKSCDNGSSDGLSMNTGNEFKGYSMRFMSDLPDGDFEMGMMHCFGDEAREYVLQNTSVPSDGDFEVYAIRSGDSLIIMNHGNGTITTEVVLRSNQSEGQARAQISIAPGEKVNITADWDNLGDDTLTIKIGKIADALDDTIYIVIIIVSMAVIAAAAIVIVMKRRGEGKEGKEVRP